MEKRYQEWRRLESARGSWRERIVVIIGTGSVQQARYEVDGGKDTEEVKVEERKTVKKTCEEAL